MRYLITGMGGSGKTTTIQTLDAQGFAAVDIEDLPANEYCKWVDARTGELASYHTGVGSQWLKDHCWIWEIERLQDYLENITDSPFFFAGYGMNQEQLYDQFDKIFLLEIEPDVLYKRLLTRQQRNAFAATPEEAQYILSWYQDWQEATKAKGAIPIPADQSGEAVSKQILEYCNNERR